jgi:hypothetical protein
MMAKEEREGRQVEMTVLRSEVAAWLRVGGMGSTNASSFALSLCILP